VPLFGDERVKAFGGETAIEPPVDHGRRGAGTVPQAEHRLQRKGAVGRRFVEVHSKTTLGVRGEFLGPHGLAGFGPAQADRMPTRRGLTEEVIEGHHPVHFRAGQVQDVGQDRDGVRRDIAEGCLDRMEHFDQGARTAFHVLDDPLNCLAFGWKHLFHRSLEYTPCPACTIPAAMQLNRFDLNLLIALDALLQEKNVTRAAERVFVSQPAMSAALQKLREFFDDQLLVRVGRDMQLTPRGLSLVEPVREALLRIQATLGTQPSFDPGTVQRTFTLIVSADALLRVMPAVFRRLAREAPGIRCHVEHFSETTLSRLEYGDADLFLGLNSLRLFGLRAFPDSLRIVDLRPVRWLCAVAKDHPTVGEQITEQQYLALPHVFGWPSGHTIPLEELVRRLLSAELDVRATTQGLLEIPFMLQGTQLVATLPEHLAQTLAKLAPIKLMPVPFETPDTREVVIWHKRNEPDPGHAWLREILIEAARDFQPTTSTATSPHGAASGPP
jgi:LysR family transcriptional regulator, nod-box dependent transcriptional activator